MATRGRQLDGGWTLSFSANSASRPNAWVGRHGRGAVRSARHQAVRSARYQAGALDIDAEGSTNPGHDARHLHTIPLIRLASPCAEAPRSTAVLNHVGCMRVQCVSSADVHGSRTSVGRWSALGMDGRSCRSDAVRSRMKPPSAVDAARACIVQSNAAAER